jgi:hypothetical protein
MYILYHLCLHLIRCSEWGTPSLRWRPTQLLFNWRLLWLIWNWRWTQLLWNWRQTRLVSNWRQACLRRHWSRRGIRLTNSSWRWSCRCWVNINRSPSPLNPFSNCIPHSLCRIIWWHFKLQVFLIVMHHVHLDHNIEWCVDLDVVKHGLMWIH